MDSEREVGRLTTLNGMIDRSDSRSYIPGATARWWLLEDDLVLGGATVSTPQPRQRVTARRLPRGRAPRLKSISAVGGFDLNPVWYDNDGEAALIQKNLIHYADGYFTQELQANGHYKALSFSSGAFYLHERFTYSAMATAGGTRRTPILPSTRRTMRRYAPTTSPPPTAWRSSARRTSS